MRKEQTITATSRLYGPASAEQFIDELRWAERYVPGGSGVPAFNVHPQGSSRQPLRRRTVTESPASLPITLRTSAFIGSMCLPSPSAMKALRNG